ncbi:dephospho-CoA kinase [Janibacter hoylei PVAS-1]|uniref:Dephospho-CoA kinase n=1 Tax=Janibacter hoylei PVAS-1 TaxID=1210046 RepID=K1E5N2_9MICO|nr:dephospho-CoA kinase [Janibacter hoylei PVAS-1]
MVVDADKIAREVVEPGEPALAAIRDRFGDTVFGPDGALDRPALGRVVFGDPEALAALESITHPAIWGRTADRFSAAEAAGTSIGVHDMPLLVEKQMAGGVPPRRRRRHAGAGPAAAARRAAGDARGRGPLAHRCPGHGRAAPCRRRRAPRQQRDA